MTMHQKIFAVIATLAAISLVVIVALAPIAAHAQAQTMCGEHSKLVKVFKDKYNETGRAIGISGETSLVEIYTSPGGETWTILAVQPNGLACIIAAGKDWMNKPVEIEGKDS